MQTVWAGFDLISCVMSSQLSSSNFVNWHPKPCVKVGGGEPSVSWRISTTFFVKKDMNLSAEYSCLADVHFLSIWWFTVVQCLRESLLKDSILFVQNEWLMITKYLCIFLTCYLHYRSKTIQDVKNGGVELFNHIANARMWSDIVDIAHVRLSEGGSKNFVVEAAPRAPRWCLIDWWWRFDVNPLDVKLFFAKLL